MKEQLEKIKMLESEKGAVTKMIADQAIHLRDNEIKLKDYEEQVKDFRDERARFVEVQEEADYLRRFKAEQVPLLEERARENELKAERYLKCLSEIQDKLRTEVPDSHFV